MPLKVVVMICFKLLACSLTVGSVHKMVSLNCPKMSVRVNAFDAITFNTFRCIVHMKHQPLTISGFSVKKATAIPTSENVCTALLLY